MEKLPKYTREKRKGNIGEAVVQYVLTRVSLVHKIDGSNDIGNDFICELIDGTTPTNTLFYVQVKYTVDEPDINPSTLAYWKGSSIPVFLFWVRDTMGALPLGEPDLNAIFRFGPNIEKIIQYKRFTSSLDKRKNLLQDLRFEPFEEQKFRNHVTEDALISRYRKGPDLLANIEATLRDNNAEVYFGSHAIEIRRITKEYKNQIKSNAWFDLFSIAQALVAEGGQGNIRNAHQLTVVAIKLLESKAKTKYPKLVHDLESLNAELRKKLD
jgi:hypothetical protein